MPDNQKQAAFLPFHAINQYMRPDYRQGVVLTALQAIAKDPEIQPSANRLIKKVIQVPGFRNSVQAPVSLKLKPTITAFEKNPAMAAVMIDAWTKTRPELRQKVFDLLASREWELLPVDADRTKLPGFITTWPHDEDFQAINQAFRDQHPDFSANEDDVSLMTVWLSCRLPFEKEGDTTSESE